MMKLLAVFLVLTVAYTEAIGGCQYHLYKFGHCIGNDIETIRNQRHAYCRQVCDSKPQCRGYYFKVDNFGGSRTMYCTLKTTMCAHPQGEGSRQMGRMWAKGACPIVEPPPRPLPAIPDKSFCVTSKGKNIPEGQVFVDECFTYKCTSTGESLIKAECQDSNGNCVVPGSGYFSCKAGSRVVPKCSCFLDKNGEVNYNYYD